MTLEILQEPVLYSVHQFKAWERCRKKYYYDTVAKLQWPTDTRVFEVGRDVHKLLDYQSKGLDVSSLVKTTPPDTQGYWAALKDHPLVHRPILENEWAFSIPLVPAQSTQPPVWLVGRIDRIIEGPSPGSIWVIDWKTGTGVPKQPAEDWQTKVYLYATVEAWPQLQPGREQPPPDAFSFVYVEVTPKGLREIQIPYSQEQHEASRKLLLETVHAMGIPQTHYPLPARCPDPKCPYRPICGIEDQHQNAWATGEDIVDPDLLSDDMFTPWSHDHDLA